MLQASNLGRTISPVSGVVVAVAGMAKISPFEVVKRTSVPVIVGLLIVIIATEIMVPRLFRRYWRLIARKPGEGKHRPGILNRA